MAGYTRTGNPKDAIRSVALSNARTRAEEYACDPAKAKELLDAALKKAHSERQGHLLDVWDYLTAQIRLISAYIRKDYRDVPWETILLCLAGILYFVIPIDLIPDFLPIGGYLDDLAVISFVISSVKKELDYFLEWEAGYQPKETKETPKTVDY